MLHEFMNIVDAQIIGVKWDKRGERGRNSKRKEFYN